MANNGIKLYSALVALVVLCALISYKPVNGRVSKSFVRGFLVGYAKGLEEGKSLVQVQPVL